MPVGGARSRMGALLAMHRADSHRTRAALADDVRGVARPLVRARTRWPRLSIRQGDRDRTVHPANAVALAAQWSALHGYGAAPTLDQAGLGVRRRSWGRPSQLPAVDPWTLGRLGHGIPVDPRTPDSGRVGAWVEDAGLSAARLMAKFWGLEPLGGVG